MTDKPNPTENRPPSKPTIPDAANDGFPVEKDVSTPPPGSDQAVADRDEEKKE